MRFERVKIAAPAPTIDGGGVAAAVSMLRSAPRDELRDVAFLREDLLPRLGLNGELLEEFPRELYPWCGRGIRSWQYPLQFAEYLVYLSDKGVQSYVEIGCRHGGTFIIVLEYLRRFGDVRRALAIDIAATPIMSDYASQTPGVEYRIVDSTSSAGRNLLGATEWGLAFIDGDHSYKGCSSDYRAVKDVARLVALHDVASRVCPGVVRLWGEIKALMPRRRIFEAVGQYRDVTQRTGGTYLGIGVVDVSGMALARPNT